MAVAVAAERATWELDEWRALALSAGAPPWLHPGWLEAWWRAFGSGERETLRVRRSGRLVGVFALRRDRLGLRATANWRSPEFGMLAADAGARSELAAEVFDRSPARVRLKLLGRDGSGLDELREEARRRGYTVRERVHERSPYVPIEGDFEAYLRTLNPKVRGDVLRKWRRLDERGGLRFEIHDGRERLDELLAEGFPLEASGWKERGGTAIVSSPTVTAFYTDVARWAADEGLLRLGFLRLDGRAIAFELMLEDERSLYSLCLGYDPAFAKWSPGLLSRFAVLRYAHEQEVGTFEQLGRESRAKLAWGKLVRDRVLFEAFAPTLLGGAASAGDRYVRPLARRLVRPGRAP